MRERKESGKWRKNAITKDSHNERELWRAVHDLDSAHDCRLTNITTSCCAGETTPVLLMHSKA